MGFFFGKMQRLIESGRSLWGKNRRAEPRLQQQISVRFRLSPSVKAQAEHTVFDSSGTIRDEIYDHSQMIEGAVLPPGLLYFAANTSLPYGTNPTSIQSRQVALLYFAITSLHPPNTVHDSAILDPEFDIELENYTMGGADT